MGRNMETNAAVFEGRVHTVVSKDLYHTLPRRGFITVKDAIDVP
jgi:hypothetical protein